MRRAMDRSGIYNDIRDVLVFEELTLTALRQKDGTAFIKCLLEREKVCGRLAGLSARLGSDVAQRFYSNETRVIERLEEERSKLLMEIDNYSQKRRAVRKYSPKFPLPTHPSFFCLKK